MFTGGTKRDFDPWPYRESFDQRTERVTSFMAEAQAQQAAAGAGALDCPWDSRLSFTRVQQNNLPGKALYCAHVSMISDCSSKKEQHAEQDLPECFSCLKLFVFVCLSGSVLFG